MKKFFQEFKKFITRGNVIDMMAVGVIIGGAFSSIVTALTNKILMPLINALLAQGGNGLESAYTFLKKSYTAEGTIELAKSIYIDWGAFITAVINFFLIALVLFIIIKAMMGAKGFLNKQTSKLPTREERKEWKTQGVNMKNRAEVLKATEELRESKKTESAPAKPTQEELLANILEELKKQNSKAKAND